MNDKELLPWLKKMLTGDEAAPYFEEVKSVEKSRLGRSAFPVQAPLEPDRAEG
ncbi:hypothetical protein EMIT07CA2_170013 [Brevibacillus sp. IT-7CA2]|uniref:hypothetical protein n=1 Tax=Brevibacillus sp. IT-7CA2 TaxID=3026436 RepID=UPI0039E19DAF